MKFLILMLATFPVFASDVIEVDYLREMDDETYRQSPRLYRAEGQHICQSPSSIGHQCKNLGVNLTDCNQAFFKLKQNDCCSGSQYGGTSIGFKLTKCTNFN